MKSRVANQRWYHSIDLGNGLATPGLYDLRPVLDRIEFPADLTGKRCLDVGTRDGFYAFEMERRGATEVVALDVDDPAMLHKPEPAAPDEYAIEDLQTGRAAFELAREVLGSTVERRPLSVYDLDPAAVGTFDFAVIGTLLLHLRDPVGALRAIRRVVDGTLLVADVISPTMTLLSPHAPASEVLMTPGQMFWTVPNLRALRRMITAAGWRIEATGRPYLVPYGPGQAPSLRSLLREGDGRLLDRLVVHWGAPHAWVRAVSGSS